MKLIQLTSLFFMFFYVDSMEENSRNNVLREVFRKNKKGGGVIIPHDTVTFAPDDKISPR
jgi:hypothetical protein